MAKKVIKKAIKKVEQLNDSKEVEQLKAIKEVKLLKEILKQKEKYIVQLERQVTRHRKVN